jgi:Mn2+/Fe2+ NRAMP family transporter
MLWSVLFSYPLMAGIQEISARIGRVTGHGLAGAMRRHSPAWVMYPVITLMVVANVINLGADIGAMGAATTLLVGGPALVYATLFALTSLLLQIFIPYSRYVAVLKWLTVVLFAYVATVFAVRVPWGEALRHTVWPAISFSPEYLTGLIAVLGTTISPYLFFWQASEEAEEEQDNPNEAALIDAPEQAPVQLKRIKMDTYIGMAFSNAVAFFIILTAAVTLHVQGKTDIQTAAQAAEALRPLAGQFAFLLFALGIIGTGLLAVPVLAGSAAYAIGEVLQWPTGLERKPLEARGFYAILAAATLIGLGLNFTAINPVQALFWSAVINGIVAGPVMIVVMLLASNARVMGRFTITFWLKLFGWAATAVMITASIGLFATWGHA